MRILVTGALGHIGSKLIRELPKSIADVEVAMMDNLSTQRYSALFGLPEEGHYHFREADVLTVDLVPFVEEADVVIHLAAITDAESSLSRGEKVLGENVEGTRRVAEACAQTGTPLIYPSTTSVYGTQEERVDEDCQPSELKPQSPYAQSKLEGEKLLHEMGETNGLRFVTCRFGTIFGVSPGMRFHTAVNRFCWQSALKQPLTVWRTALHQVRPYLDLNDAIRSLVFIIENEMFDCSVYNVLTFNKTVDDILRSIRRHLPDIQIEYVDSKLMNQLSFEVSHERFVSKGFEFLGCLDKSIRETIGLIRRAVFER